MTVSNGPGTILHMQTAKCWTLVACLFGSLLVAASTAAAASTAVATGANGTNQSQQSLLDSFDKTILPAIERAVRRPATEQGGDIAWSDSYLLTALVDMLEVRPEDKYAEAAVKLSDWMMKSRDDAQGWRDQIRDKIVTTWGSTNYSRGQRYAWAVHTGMIAAPMARLAGVFHKDLALQTKWAKDADRLLKCAQEAVSVHDAEYRAGPGQDEAYVYCPYLKKHLPLNMQNALARAWLAIDDASVNPKYRERTARLAKFMKNRLRLGADGAYTWAYWPPPEGATEQCEDISHASINVDFAVLCFEHGIVFDREDLNRLEKTLLNHVIVADDKISNTVKGGGKYNEYAGSVFRWGRLGNHCPAVTERLRQLLESPSFKAEGTFRAIAATRLLNTNRLTSN